MGLILLPQSSPLSNKITFVSLWGMLAFGTIFIPRYMAYKLIGREVFGRDGLVSLWHFVYFVFIVAFYFIVIIQKLM